MNQVLEDLSALRYNKHYRIWKPFMQKYNCQRIAEIGVRQGRNFDKMVKHNPELAVAVDLWRETGVRSENDQSFEQERLDLMYKKLCDRYPNYERVVIVRDYSVLASELFPDNYFDLIYIDADHTFEGCYRDILAWYPKVRKGGFLLGDDYRDRKTSTGVRFGVIKAVEKFCRENKLSYFVFPQSKWGLIK